MMKKVLKGIETIVYFAEGDMRKSVNVLQAATTEGEVVSEESVYEVVSKAKPQEISNMINKALVGDFLGARTLLRETMVLQGTSGEDMVTQIYQEVSKRVVEGKMEPDFYIDLINSIADCDFRIREGANPRIQLEALLTKFI